MLFHFHIYNYKLFCFGPKGLDGFFFREILVRDNGDGLGVFVRSVNNDGFHSVYIFECRTDTRFTAASDDARHGDGIGGAINSGFSTRRFRAARARAVFLLAGDKSQGHGRGEHRYHCIFHDAAMVFSCS